jgi:hypothetical protein
MLDPDPESMNSLGQVHYFLYIGEIVAGSTRDQERGQRWPVCSYPGIYLQKFATCLSDSKNLVTVRL